MNNFFSQIQDSEEEAEQMIDNHKKKVQQDLEKEKKILAEKRTKNLESARQKNKEIFKQKQVEMKSLYTELKNKAKNEAEQLKEQKEQSIADTLPMAKNFLLEKII